MATYLTVLLAVILGFIWLVLKMALLAAVVITPAVIILWVDNKIGLKIYQKYLKKYAWIEFPKQ